MALANNIFNAFLVPITIGVLMSALLFFFLRRKIKSGFSISASLKGFGICAISNIALLVLSMGYISGYFYFVICIPFLFFSFMLNKKVIKETRLKNTAINFIYKATATLFIWFMAFFPFSLLGVMEMINIPEKNARNQEIVQMREEIRNFETFADLTPFGLGIYKLRHEGDGRLWDITQLPRTVITMDGVDLVFESHFNRRDDETWDNTWGNSNVGKDVLYDIYFYEGTYLIVTPLWERPGALYYWGYIYLCKNIDKDVDLFDIGIPYPEVVEKLQVLPGEKVSRKELAVKLGKAY